MDSALKTPVAERDPPKAGEPPGLVPGGTGGLGVMCSAEPKGGIPLGEMTSKEKPGPPAGAGLDFANCANYSAIP